MNCRNTLRLALASTLLVANSLFALPDLTITDVTVPAGPFVPGDTVSVQVEITNIGPDPVPASSNFTVSATHAGATIVSDEVDLAILPGGIINVELPITLADSVANGTYTISNLVVDANLAVAEADESNNTEAVGGDYTVNAQPDLVVNAVTIPEGPFVPGDEVTITVDILNLGSAGVPAGSGFTVSATFTGAGGPSVVTSNPLNVAIPANGTVEASLTYTVSGTEPNGGIVVTAVTADADGAITESNEANNVLALAGSVIVEAFADLTITEIELIGEPYYPGSTIVARLTIENTGERAADPFTIAGFVTPPSSGFGSTPFSFPDTLLGGLGSEAAMTVTISTTIPLDNPNGSYDVEFVIDSTGAVLEEDEDNNLREAAFSIDTQPDLAIVDVTYETGTWQAGDPVPFSLTYINREFFGGARTKRVDNDVAEQYQIEVVLSEDNVFGNDDDFLIYMATFQGGNTAPFGNLIPGETVTLNWTQAMPRNLHGDYFVLAKIDTLELVEEYQEEDITDNGNNVWYAREATKISLVPTATPQPTTERISLKTDGTEGTALSEDADVSSGGRYVVFSSKARLVDADTDSDYDIYLRDNHPGNPVTLLLSANLPGRSGSGDSRFPRISSDGRYVTFESANPSLVASDTNGHSDIFLVDTTTLVIERISVSSAEAQSNGPSHLPDLSDDGRYVVFKSSASNLAGTVTAGRSHVYVRDRTSGVTRLLSQSGGTQGNDHSAQAQDEGPAISGNGGFVTFASYADNLDGASAAQQIFRVNVDGTGMTRLSETGGGVAGDGHSFSPTINEDGSVVAFVSSATNLDLSVVGADTNGVPDLFVWEAGTVERVLTAQGSLPNDVGTETPSTLGARSPSISADGRFIVFRTQSNNWLSETVTRSDNTVFDVTDPGTGLIGGYSDLNLAAAFQEWTDYGDVSVAGADLYLYDRDAGSFQLVSVNRFGYQAPSVLITVEDTVYRSVPNVQDGVISPDGRYVAFSSEAIGWAGFSHPTSNRLSDDANEVRDVFLHDLRTVATGGSGDQRQPPTAIITYPRDGGTYWTNAELNISVLANDTDGRVEQVEFYIDGVRMNVVGDAPYIFTWGPSNDNFGPGLHTLYAVATDNEGRTGVSTPVVITVQDAAVPVVSMIAPPDADTNGVADDSVRVDEPLILSASATYAPGALGHVTRMDFRINGVVAGSGTVQNGQWNSSYTPTQLGQFEVVAIAVDSSGNVYDSLPLLVNVTLGDVPAITFVDPDTTDTTPADGIADTAVAQNEPTTVRALITDDDGIQEASLFVNGSFESSGTVSSEVDVFEFPWRANLLGNNTLEIRAVDQRGNETRESFIYTVVQGSVPTVQILSPDPTDVTAPLGVADSTLDPGQEITVTIAATDAEGPLTRVDVFVNGSYLGEAIYDALADEYTIDFTASTIGTLTIRAEATDSANNVTSESVTYVVSSGAAPTIEFISPPEGATYLPGTQVPVQVRAADADGLVTGVDFFVNGVLVGAGSSDLFRTFLTLPSAGTYVLTARARDNLGNETFSAPLSVNAGALDSRTPRVLVDHPLPLGNGDTVNDVSVASSMFLNVRVTDLDTPTDDGDITEVTFFVNGQAVGSLTGGQVTAYDGRYAMRLDPNAPGSFAIHAEVVEGTGLTARRGQAIPILLDVGALEAPMPEVSIQIPFSQANLSEEIELIAQVESGLENTTRVDFYINGLFVGSDSDLSDSTDGAFRLPWRPTEVGTFEVSARVVQVDPNDQTYDNWALAEPVSIDVVDFAPTAPTVVLTQPSFTEATVLNPIDLQASVTPGARTIREVRFYANGVLVSTDSTYPYTASYTPVSIGQHRFQAQAVDQANIIGQSPVVTVNVSALGSPGIALLTPTSGSSVIISQSVLVTADARAIGGGNLRVDFYANGTIIGTDSVFPYRLTWKPSSQGSFALTARATETVLVGDQEVIIGTATSPQRIVTVTPSALPVVTFETPGAPGQPNPTVGSDVFVNVSAVDPDGFVDYVEFFVDGVPLGSRDNDAPFSTFWRPSTIGTFTLSALAVDNSGNQVLTDLPVTVGLPTGSAPSITLGITASGNVTPGSRVVVSANVFDDDPTDLQVAFFLDGQLLGSPQTEPPYFVVVDPDTATGQNVYALTAVASDQDGNSRAFTLTPLYISNVSVEQPNITIVSPDPADTLTEGSRVSIRAELSGGAARNVRDVIFYANGVEIGRDATSPYTLDWLPDQTGDVEIVVATLQPPVFYDHDFDNDTPNIETTPVNVSAPVNVTVNAATGALPAVSLEVLPTPFGESGQLRPFAIGSSLLLYAEATDYPDAGTVGDNPGIAEVSFFVNGELLGTTTSAPFAFPWQVQREGRYFLNATVRDNNGNLVTSSFVSVDVSPDVRPGRSVIFTAPATGRQGSTLSLVASVAGFISPPSGVTYYINGQQIQDPGNPVTTSASNSYTFNWKANIVGDVFAFASAERTFGNGTVEAAVSTILPVELLPNEPPVLDSLTFTFPGQSIAKPDPLAGDPVTILAQISDSGPIEFVQLLRDGQPLEGKVATVPPYQITDTPPGLGTYTYSVSIRDSGGLTVNPASSLTVDVVEGEVPIVELISPADGAEFTPSQTIRLRANATDPDGSITSVQFYVDDGEVGTADTTRPFEAIYTSERLGVLRIYAVARDNSGNITQSAERTVTVVEDLPPVVTEFSNSLATNIARLNQQIRWTIRTDDDYGVASVRLFRNNIPIANPGGVAVPIDIFDTPPLTGEYEYTVEVTDTGGNVAEISLGTITVVLGAAPVVSIIQPSDGEEVQIGSPLRIRASAIAGTESGGVPTGFVAKVEIFVNSQRLAELTGAPYEVSFTPAAEATYSVTAVATSDTGLSATSPVVTLFGIDENVPEITSFISDARDNRAFIEQPVNFVVEADDEVGLTQVRLLVDGEEIAFDLEQPYEFTVQPGVLGAISFQAEAVNQEGNSALSAPIVINVRLPDAFNDADELVLEDFIYQSFLDLLHKAPTPEQLASYTTRLRNRTLTEAPFLAELYTLADYADVHNAIKAGHLLRGTWPTQDELRGDSLIPGDSLYAGDVRTIRDRGLAAMIEENLAGFEARYVAAVNSLTPAPAVPVAALPSKTSSAVDINRFIDYLWRWKYGVVPTTSQRERLRTFFNINSVPGFMALVVRDAPSRSGGVRVTSPLGFTDAPVSALEAQADAASLLLNVLRIPHPSPHPVYTDFTVDGQVAPLAALIPTDRALAVLNLDGSNATYRDIYRQRFGGTLISSLTWLEANWAESEWFGLLQPSSANILYHLDLGWLGSELITQQADCVWVYDPQLGWLWTCEESYPRFRQVSTGEWILIKSSNVSGQRRVYSYNRQTWQR